MSFFFKHAQKLYVRSRSGTVLSSNLKLSSNKLHHQPLLRCEHSKLSRTETLAYITVASKGIHSWSLTFRLDPYLVHTHRQMNPMLWQDNLSLPFKFTEKILQSEHSKETFLEEL